MDDRSTTADAAATPIVALAKEIDSTNCAQTAADLAFAFGPDVRAVIADLSQTTFCDSSAVRALLQAHMVAASRGAELRLVVTSGAVLRIFELTGLTSTLRLYPSIEAAIGDGQAVRMDSPSESDALE